MDREKLKEKVHQFIDENPKKTDGEIAQAMGVGLPVVIDVLLELRREKKIVEV